MSDAKLPIVQNVRDLGVLVDNRLTFRDHINSIISGGNVKTMQKKLWRCFLCKDVKNLITAFTTYVRPMLEYCSPVWSPVSVSHINQLESVQRRFTKRLPELRSLTCDERCARLGINRLELRRLHADLTLCYKIIHGLVFLSCDRFFTIVYDNTTRDHSLKLFVWSSRAFFAVRVIDVWN